MSPDSHPLPVDDLSCEELYSEECTRVEALLDVSRTMQTVLDNAPPIEPAGSHIDRRNERIEVQLTHVKTLLNDLDRLHDELRQR